MYIPMLHPNDFERVELRVQVAVAAVSLIALAHLGMTS